MIVTHQVWLFQLYTAYLQSYWPPRLLWEMTWHDHVRVINIFLHPQIGTLISRKCRYGWFLVTLGGWCLLPDIFKDWSEALGSLCHDCCMISSTLGFNCSRKYPFPNPSWSLKSFYGRKFFTDFSKSQTILVTSFVVLNIPVVLETPMNHPWACPTMISSAISSTASWSKRWPVFERNMARKTPCFSNK